MPTSALVLTVRHTPRERPSSRGFFQKIVEGPDYSLPLTSTSCGRLLASCRPSSYSATYSYVARNVCLTHVSSPKTNRFTLICGFSITPHCSNHTNENLQFFSGDTSFSLSFTHGPQSRPVYQGLGTMTRVCISPCARASVLYNSWFTGHRVPSFGAAIAR